MTAPVTLTYGQLALFVAMIKRRGRKMLATYIEGQGYLVSRLGKLGGLGLICEASYNALRRRLWGEKCKRGHIRAFVTEPVT